MGVWDQVQTLLDGLTDEELGILPPPEPGPSPQITAQTIRDAIADLVAGMSHLDVAMKYRVRQDQVARLDRMRQAEIAERTAEPE